MLSRRGQLLLAAVVAAAGIGVAVTALGGPSSDSDCNGYRAQPGFWQQAQAPSEKIATRHAQRDIACLGLKGMTQEQVVGLLGKPVSMRAGFGATDAERFRVWQLDQGAGVYVGFDGDEHAVVVKEQAPDKDGDIF